MSSSVNYQHLPATVGTAIIAVAAGWFAAAAPTDIPNRPASILPVSYTTQFNPSTYSTTDSRTNSLFSSNNIHFEQEISKFYAHFLSQQKPLGEEFQKILYDNLWDLYER